MRIVRVVQTSMACPAQWDAWDEDGQYYYLRFRHGYGTVTKYEDENWVGAEPAQKSERIAGFELDSDEDRGWISLEEFAEHAVLTLDPKLVRTGFGDHLADELVTSEGLPLDVATAVTKPWRELGE